jgi:hypothetical protein
MTASGVDRIGYRRYNTVMTPLSRTLVAMTADADRDPGPAPGPHRGPDTDAPDGAAQRRRAVVEVAARVLAEDGPHGLSLRRVAAEAGGSTQIVYTLFGGKPGPGRRALRRGLPPARARDGRRARARPAAATPSG